MSSVGSPTYALAKEIARFFSPLAGASKSYVKNSEHLVVKIENTALNSCDLLVSFDVKSLFTSVPINEEMSEVATLLLANSSLEDRTTMSPATICRLTELCLHATYFEFQEVFMSRWMELLWVPLSPQ